MPAKYTPSVALQKLMKYCAYQERSHRQVKEKLHEWGIYSPDSDELIVKLIAENFLNEERFARAYVRGKFRMKGWGRNKIIQGLKQHQIHQNLMNMAMQEIDEVEYLKMLRQSLEKKLSTTKETNPFKLKSKLASYAMAKGYEGDLVWDELRKLEVG